MSFCHPGSCFLLELISHIPFPLGSPSERVFFFLCYRGKRAYSWFWFIYGSKFPKLTSLLVIPIHPLVLSLAMPALLHPFASWSGLCWVLSDWRRLLEPTGPV